MGGPFNWNSLQDLHGNGKLCGQAKKDSAGEGMKGGKWKERAVCKENTGMRIGKNFLRRLQKETRSRLFHLDRLYFVLFLLTVDSSSLIFPDFFPLSLSLRLWFSSLHHLSPHPLSPSTLSICFPFLLPRKEGQWHPMLCNVCVCECVC